MEELQGHYCNLFKFKHGNMEMLSTYAQLISILSTSKYRQNGTL